MPEKASCAAALSLSISRPSGRSGSRFDAELDENRARVPRLERILILQGTQAHMAESIPDCGGRINESRQALACWDNAVEA